MRQKTEQKRTAILLASKELFLLQGYEKTSMAEVAAKAGGSKATLYSYFSSKEEIFDAVMEASAEKEIAPAFQELRPEPSLSLTLTQFGVNYLYSILDPDILALRRLAQSEAGRSDIGSKFFEKGPKVGWQMVANFLEQVGESSALEITTPWGAAMHLKGLLESEILDECILGVRPRPNKNDLKAMVSRAVGVFMKGYAA